MDIVAALQNLVVSGAAAFIAYLAWNEYQKPKLAADDIWQMDIVNDDDPAIRWRLPVGNEGESPARDTEAFLWLKGWLREENKLVVSQTRLPWGNRRAEIFASSPSDFSNRAIIGPGSYHQLAVLRSHRGNLSPPPYEETSDSSFALIEADELPEDASLEELGSSALVTDDDRSPRQDQLVERKNTLTPDQVESIEWEESFIGMECSNGNAPIVTLDLGWDSDEEVPEVTLAEAEG